MDKAKEYVKNYSSSKTVARCLLLEEVLTGIEREGWVHISRLDCILVSVLSEIVKEAVKPLSRALGCTLLLYK